MIAKQFFDWQTDGGSNNFMRLGDALEKSDVTWCATGGVAVTYWACEPMVIGATKSETLPIPRDWLKRILSFGRPCRRI